MRIITPAFLEELLMFAQRKDVGIAGAQTLDEKDLILSSDLVIGDSMQNLAVEINQGERYDAPGYMGRNYYAHNISAVSGCACMAAREDFVRFWESGAAKSVFGRMLEMCFLIRKENRQVVLNPYALCRISKAEHKEELLAGERQSLWDTNQEQILAGDPFYNRNLSIENHWKMK